MENEVMIYDEEVMETEAEAIETEDSGMGTGVAMLIGAGLAFASTAIVKLGKKAYTAYKTKKGNKSDEEQVEEPSDEE